MNHVQDWKRVNYKESCTRVKESELQGIMYKSEREWITKNHVQEWKGVNYKESCTRVKESELQRIMYKSKREWITKNHVREWKRVNYKESCTRVKESELQRLMYKSEREWNTRNHVREWKSELLSESDWHSWLLHTIPSPHTTLQLHISPLPWSPTTNVSAPNVFTMYLSPYRHY
jgi:hypothetical protein